MAILTLRNLDGGTRLFACKTLFSKHEHCSKDDGQPLTVILHGSNRGQIGLVNELAATAHLKLFSTPFVSAKARNPILPRLLHNFRGIPAFTAWIETGEGLLPFDCASPQPCIASRGIEIVSSTD
jgi:hypothetical protein